MRLSVPLAAAFGVAVSALTIKDAKSNVLPGAYIVQFESASDSTDTFYQNLTRNGIDALHRQTFQPNILAGTSFHLTADKKSDLDLIASFGQVKVLSPVLLFSHGTVLPEKRWQNLNVEKLQEDKLKKRASVDSSTFSPHVMAGVDKLQAEGLDGSGIVIAEIDSGIDYKLAALGGCFGPGCKVAFGYDLVGDAYTGSNAPVPDSDPIDCGGHGTHVAGIIAAANDPYVIGVAPNVTMGIYKVFGCKGLSSSDILIQAFTMAYNHGVDIITASIGGASGWPEEPWTAATANIVALGTPCMLAAGNDGAEGIYYASAASAGTDVTSVGSVDNTNFPLVLTIANSTVGTSTSSFGYTPGVGSFASIILPLFANSYDTTIANDFCSAVTADISGKIALIRRGGCLFVDKAQNAFNAGAKYVMFYNNIPGSLIVTVPSSPITAAGMVDPAVGAGWIKDLSAGRTVTLTFSAKGSLSVVSPGQVNTLSGGRLSVFTTWNPTNENAIKPVVSAPGGSILSTYLSAQGGYAALSGTSMATPFTAGVVALYLQAKGKGISPKFINAALSSSATPLVFNSGSTDSAYLASVAQQGGGLINAYKMIHSGIFVTEANLAFNDTANHVKNAAFYVQNNGKTTQTFSLTHAPAANAYAFNSSDTTLVATFPPPMDTKCATVAISSPSLSIKPGEKKRVTIAATPDPSLDASLVPFYSGYINITGGGESISIPYGGVATTMHDINILAAEGPWPEFDTELATSNSSDGVYTFKPSAGGYPILLWNLRWATLSIRMDIISVSGPNIVTAAGLATAGSIPDYPSMWVPRGVTNSFSGAQWNGTLADGKKVQSGTYKFALRLAKVFADLNRGREYETYYSEAFVMDMS